MLAQEEIKWEFGLDWLNKKVSLVPCHRRTPSTCQDYFVVLLTYYTLSCLKSSQKVPFYPGSNNGHFWRCSCSSKERVSVWWEFCYDFGVTERHLNCQIVTQFLSKKRKKWKPLQIFWIFEFPALFYNNFSPKVAVKIASEASYVWHF